MEQWAHTIKILFDFNRKDEELDGKFLNNVLGRDERLKRVIEVHSNLNTSSMFLYRIFVKRKIIFLYYFTILDK